MVKIGPAFFDYVSEGGHSRKHSRTSSQARDLIALVPILFLILAFSIIIFKLFYIQIIRGDYYKNLANENRTKTQSLPAPRGIIYDRLGRPLVSNSPSFSIGEKGALQRISRDEALKLIAKNKRVESDIQREYLYGDRFAHVLGYVGQISPEEIILPEFKGYSMSDLVGKVGLEQKYEKLLHGKNGKKLFEVDAKGKIVRELGKQEPIPGENMKTTLDLDIQTSIKDAMNGVKKGAVVVSDPKNGGILGLYSAPSFDPNVFTHPQNYEASGGYKTRKDILSDSEGEPLLNRAISGTYPPGSTFKLVTAIAALENGGIKPNTQIEDTGILHVGGSSFGNWYFLQYGRTEGALDVVGAIKRSNDIFFYKAAEAAGVEKISQWAQGFGLGARFGIDLPGEEAGTVPSPSWKQNNIGEQWFLGDTYNYGIGQGYLLTTPLQMNTLTAVFANGGTLFKPHLTYGFSKTIKKNFIKREHLELVREGMRQSCETGGVAWPLFDFKVKNERLSIDNKDFIEEASGGAKMVRIKLACKTGTAETGKDTKPHAWITAFAPFYKPEIAVTILVENGGEGSSIAGPIARKILQDYFEKK